MKFTHILLFLFAFVEAAIVTHNAHGQSLFQLPKVSTTPSGCLSNEKGYMVYNTTDNKIYYCNGTNYQPLSGISTNFFSLDGYSIVSQGKIKLSGLKPNEGAVKDKVLTAVDDFGNVEWKTTSAGSGGGSAGFSVVGIGTGAANAQTIPAATSSAYTKIKIFQNIEFDDTQIQYHNSTNGVSDYNLISNDSLYFKAETSGTYHFDVKLQLSVTNPSINDAITIQVRKNGLSHRVSSITFINHTISGNSTTVSNFQDCIIPFNIKLLDGDKIDIWVTSSVAVKIYSGKYSSIGGYKVY